MSAKKTILLFDVDGTLTQARKKIEPWMCEYLTDLRKKIPLAVVGGSDLCKVTEQLGESVDEVVKRFDYVFTENGLVGFRNAKSIPSMDIKDKVPEAKLQKFLNWVFAYFAKLELPCKRGNFVEFRRGMINVSPIGRSCSYDERLDFVKFDTQNGIRQKFVTEMRKEFPAEEYGLHFVIGGQISVDVFPIGWDKRFCLQYLLEDGYETIHFFGDKTMPGGNDHEVFADDRTIGHTVTEPKDTKDQLEKLLPTIL